MMSNNFLYSVLFLAVALIYFKFHKWWLNARKEKDEVLNKDFKTVGIVKDWIIIGLFFIASLICFVEFLLE
jgi:hypothetical protein